MTKNILVCDYEDEDNVLLYVEEEQQDRVTVSALESAFTKLKKSFSDIIEIAQEELQYYCIDDRLWVDEGFAKGIVRINSR